MICDRIKLIASAHLDRQLTNNDARNYLGHVENCADCRAHLAELEQVSSVLKSTGRPDAPPELRSYVMSVISAG
jgi:predicted anti-sigma-YlaC factor YlaD